MECQSCRSDRIISIGGKCQDMCWAEFNGKEYDGYVPTELTVGKDGYGDYLQFKYCLECGQIQGRFPEPNPKFYEER